jgi:hypothetical protein
MSKGLSGCTSLDRQSRSVLYALNDDTSFVIWVFKLFTQGLASRAGDRLI